MHHRALYWYPLFVFQSSYFNASWVEFHSWVRKHYNNSGKSLTYGTHPSLASASIPCPNNQIYTHINKYTSTNIGYTYIQKSWINNVRTPEKNCHTLETIQERLIITAAACFILAALSVFDPVCFTRKENQTTASCRQQQFNLVSPESRHTEIFSLTRPSLASLQLFGVVNC